MYKERLALREEAKRELEELEKETSEEQEVDEDEDADDDSNNDNNKEDKNNNNNDNNTEIKTNILNADNIKKMNKANNDKNPTTEDFLTTNANSNSNDNGNEKNENDDGKHNVNDSLESNESKETQPTSKEDISSFDNLEENIFANPFTPGHHALDDENKTGDYAIPFDLDNKNHGNNNNDKDNGGEINNDTDDIWANWTGPFGDDDHNNDRTQSNDGDNDNNDAHSDINSNNGERKVRKSEVFADPFHWDTDDENNAKDKNGDNDDNQEHKEKATKPDLKMRTSILDLDLSQPFKDPFHGTPKTKLTPNNTTENNLIDDIVEKEEKKTETVDEMDINKLDDGDEKLFANPFINDKIEDDDKDKINDNNTNENNKNHEELLKLLFGSSETKSDEDDGNDNRRVSFANPFRQTDDDGDKPENEEKENKPIENKLDMIKTENKSPPLSPMVQLNQVQNDDNTIPTHTDNPFTKPKDENIGSPSLPSQTASPFQTFQISTETPTPMIHQRAGTPLNLQLTPVPQKTRDSGRLIGMILNNLHIFYQSDHAILLLW